MVDNPKYWNGRTNINSQWYLQFEPSINCRACKGSGYVIGNIKDAIETLKFWKSDPKSITEKELRQAVEILVNVFSKD